MDFSKDNDCSIFWLSLMNTISLLSTLISSFCVELGSLMIIILSSLKSQIIGSRTALTWNESCVSCRDAMPSELDTSESASELYQQLIPTQKIIIVCLQFALCMTNCTTSTLQHWMKRQCGIMWLRREYFVFSGNGSHQHSTWSNNILLLPIRLAL